MAQPTFSGAPAALGDYELLDKLAEGGMCQVFRGRHRPSGQYVAVKILPAHTAAKSILLRRFEQEFASARRLDHPNIVRVLDFCGTHRTPFLVMELVEGESLGAKVEREGRIPEAEALRIIAQVSLGLQYAHAQGVIHRDIKPDNLLLLPTGTVKITDLGLVKELLIDQDLTRTGRGLGTPHYMAPEQFRNAKTVDVRADIYSLGATLFTLVTGTMPFGNSSPMEAWLKKMEVRVVAPRSLVPELSERINRVILRSLESDPSQRPASCQEFMEGLMGPPPVNRQPAGERWELRYTNREGGTYVISNPLERLQKLLDEGKLNNAQSLEARRSPAEEFAPLRCFEEFRDLLPATIPDAVSRIEAEPDALAPRPEPVTPQAQLYWAIVLAGMAGLAAGLVLFHGR